MRKLLTILNAMLRSGEYWRAEEAIPEQPPQADAGAAEEGRSPVVGEASTTDRGEGGKAAAREDRITDGDVPAGRG
ncbi:MAG: hypothetical protein F4X41_03610 [Chloroflexi bacterium]|nr:hypothetical protein [Chloroflexota bacterium]